MIRPLPLIAAACIAVAGCSSGNGGTPAPGETAQPSPSSANAGPIAATPVADAPFTVTEVADLDSPWAMAFVPGTQQALVTEKDGRLLLLSTDGAHRTIAGVPPVVNAGQGGLGDVVPHPDFASNRLVYLSWAEAGDGGSGAAVGRARLSDDMSRLENLEVIWRQSPKKPGDGHYAHRIAFGPDGLLYISSGERKEFTPAQDMDQNLGKIVRLTDSGGIPSDNPWAGEGGVRAQIWALGLRNPLGIAFDDAGRLWEIEMGPKGGDELNLIRRQGNYGYPNASNGDHYDGRDIPDHAAGDGYIPPVLWWTPVISPGHLMIYRGNAFPQWRGSGFVAALSGTGLVRIAFDGDDARQAERWDTGFRVRAAAEGPDGAIWLVGDGDRGGEGRIWRLDPR